MSNARHTVGGATTHPTRRPTRGGGGGGVARAPRAWAGGMEKAPHANSAGLPRQSQRPLRTVKRSPQDFEQAMKAAHPVCEKMIREADQRYQQLAAHLEQSQEEKARLQSMADQANADKHAACNEGYIRRAELNTVLEEIHAVATSLTGKVWKKLEESNNVYFSTCLPGMDMRKQPGKGRRSRLVCPAVLFSPFTLIL
ncbi:hypothetical protein N7470_000627 [Penicillium chermesinum]|nr:hypothetical protein N7470_000627 [Penicillium chermesinum]